MHSRVEIAAEAGSPGVTRFSRLLAEGGLAVRRTSAVGVHLVGTAAGPIGDDVVEMAVTVGRGAHLTVRGVAATICLPGASEKSSTVTLTVMLHQGSSLELALPPLIVCRGARLMSSTEVSAETSARLTLDEQVSLGRSGEHGGLWSGRITVDVHGRPVLRQTQTSESVLAALSSGLGRMQHSGAHVSRLRLEQAAAPTRVSTFGRAMTLDLAAGGRLSTSIGRDLGQAHHDLASLDALELRRDTAGAVAD